MAIAIMLDGVGVTQAQYEQVLHAAVPNGAMPEGMVSHIAGPSDDGFCVVTVWESEAALQRHVADRLGAALAAAGITTRPRIFPITNQLP